MSTTNHYDHHHLFLFQAPARPYFFRRPSLRFPPGKATLTTSTPAPSTTTPRPQRSTPRRRFAAAKDTNNNNSNNASVTASGVLGVSASQQVIVSTTPKPRFKFASRRPYKPSTPTTTPSSTTPEDSDTDPDPDDISNDTSDQTLEPSIQRVKSHEDTGSVDSGGNSILEGGKGQGKGKGKGKDSLEELGDIALSLNPLLKVGLQSRRRPAGRGTTTSASPSSSTERVVTFDRLRTRPRIRTTHPTTSATPTTTTTPTPPVTRSTLRRRRPQPQQQPFERLVSTPAPIIITTGSYKPITIEYDYYDEGDVRILGQLPANSKVLIHASGVIQCLDQGNFPHPVSCRKFISCAKMENGDVIGWEYTCPDRLSFDPVGGICNWSAGLGCRE